MSTDFDYRKAWDELAHPGFLALPENVRDLYDDTGKLREYINQLPHAAPRCTWPKREDLVKEGVWPFRSRFEEVPVEILAQAASICYYLGHWGYGNESQKSGGAGWKFKYLCEEILADKGAADKPEAWYQANWKPLFEGPRFNKHKEGSEFDNDELGWKYQNLVHPEFELVRVDYVNHRVEGHHVAGHPFMIGPKHFPKDNSMYIKPEQAPCAMRGCGMPYEAHKSDRVMLLKCTRMLTNKEAAAKLSPMTALMEADKLDGIGLIENQGFEILPEDKADGDIDGKDKEEVKASGDS